jgi:hypothetical protein
MAELDVLAADGLAGGARLWHADLVAGDGQSAEVIALATPASDPADLARLDEVARRLRAAAADPETDVPSGLSVVFVDASQAAALRQILGRGVTPRRWQRRRGRP